MIVSLSPTQQGRVYNSFSRSRAQINKMDEATRRGEIVRLRDNLQMRVKEQNIQSLHQQVTIIDYLLLREHEEALHFPRTTVPVRFVPLFQNISVPDLLAMVKRLVAFPTSAVLANPPQPVQAAMPASPDVPVTVEAKYQIYVDSFNAVRHGRITSPENIRYIAQHFLELENDAEANKNFPFDAGEAARILLRQAKLYEDHARAPGGLTAV